MTLLPPGATRLRATTTRSASDRPPSPPAGQAFACPAGLFAAQGRTLPHDKRAANLWGSQPFLSIISTARFPAVFPSFCESICGTGAGRARAFCGHTATQRMQVMQRAASVCAGWSAEIAPAGHSRAQVPHALQASVACGAVGMPAHSLYGRLPGVCGVSVSPRSSLAAMRAPNAASCASSCASGRPAASGRTIECSASSAAEAITRNPCPPSRSSSSTSASSYARPP